MTRFIALLIVGLLVVIAARPGIEDSAFYREEIACLADALVPSANAREVEVYSQTPVMGGRCTLASNTPVMTANVLSATTVFYAPYSNNRVAVWTGVRFVNWYLNSSSPLSNVLANSSTAFAGPAVAAASSTYDYYVWPCSATALCMTRSPAWTVGSGAGADRGTGAGTAELDCLSTPGICTNAVAIVNGPAANRGTHVCTIATDPGATVDWKIGGFADLGGYAYFGVWNRYNQVSVRGTVGDTTDSWTNGNATFHASNGSNSNRVTYVYGSNDNGVAFAFHSRVTSGATNNPYIAIGIDSTTVNGPTALGVTGSLSSTISTGYSGMPGIGQHYAQALEAAGGGVTCTFVGDFAGATMYHRLNYDLRM